VKSAVETLNPTRVKLTVEVPFDELKPSMDKAYKTIGGQIQVPGFRRGKIPTRIIDQRVGRAAVLQEAVNDALPGLYQQAVNESAVRVMGQPEVEVTDVPDTDGSELRFTAEVDVRPEITLPDFATLEVTVDGVEVTDADVDERLEALRVRFGTLTGVDRAVESGDFVSLDLRAVIGDEEIETANGVSYEVGAGNLLTGIDEAVTGMAKGETKTFTSALAAGEHAGEEADITVTVQSVKVRELPEVDDDFAQLASEFDTVDELKADLRTQAVSAKEFDQGVQARDKVLEALTEAVEVPVPEGVVQDEVHRHLENENREDDHEHGAEVEVEARKALRTQLLLDAVVEQESVKVDQGELVEYIVAQAPRFGMDPNAFAQAMDQAGQVPSMVAEVARRKALSIVMERAQVTDSTGAVVDLGAAADGEDDTEAPAEGSGAEAPAAEAPAKKAPAKTAAAADEAPAATDEAAAEAPAKKAPAKRAPAKKAAAAESTDAPAES
jgi:trigger factor